MSNPLQIPAAALPLNIGRAELSLHVGQFAPMESGASAAAMTETPCIAACASHGNVNEDNFDGSRQDCWNGIRLNVGRTTRQNPPPTLNSRLTSTALHEQKERNISATRPDRNHLSFHSRGDQNTLFFLRYTSSPLIAANTTAQIADRAQNTHSAP